MVEVEEDQVMLVVLLDLSLVVVVVMDMQIIQVILEILLVL
jgi:hypothetical protein